MSIVLQHSYIIYMKTYAVKNIFLALGFKIHEKNLFSLVMKVAVIIFAFL